MLYIGLEYGLTNNSKLAERFFSQALSIAPEDPFVIHEVAVVAFQNGEWVTEQQTRPHHTRLTIVKLHRIKELALLVSNVVGKRERNVCFEFSWSANFGFICRISWKNAERLFLDAMEKIKAIGSEVTANLYAC